MAWQDTMLTMLRALIGDLDATTYSDARLEQLLVVSAHYVIHELDFDRTYTINITSPNISPDPTSISGDTNNDTFIDFVVLKAACMADWSTYRTKALASGIKARCGPAMLETMGHITGFKELIEFGPCAAYDVRKKEYKFGNFKVHGILSPFVSNAFHPEDILGSSINRDR